MTKKVSNKTKDLFWLKFRSGAYNFLAGSLIISGLCLLAFMWVLGLILIGAGIFFLIKAKQQILEYKMSSGYIIHQGA